MPWAVLRHRASHCLGMNFASVDGAGRGRAGASFEYCAKWPYPCFMPAREAEMELLPRPAPLRRGPGLSCQIGSASHWSGVGAPWCPRLAPQPTPKGGASPAGVSSLERDCCCLTTPWAAASRSQPQRVRRYNPNPPLAGMGCRDAAISRRGAAAAHCLPAMRGFILRSSSLPCPAPPRPVP